MAELRSANEGTWRGLVSRVGLMAVLATAALVPTRAAQAQADPDRGYATQPFTPPSFKMPTGAGCAGDVSRWQAVQDNDYASGNIGLKVYHQIRDEIAGADALCRAGHDPEARGLIHASKRRHGYPD